MTGYGKSEALLENGKLTVEFRSVNGKNADINIKTSLLPKDKEMGVRKKIADKLQRGTIDMFLTWEPNASEGAKAVNIALAKEYFSQIQALGSEIGAVNLPLHEPNYLLATLLRMPDVIDAKKQDVITDANWPLVEKAVDEALAQDASAMAAFDGGMEAEKMNGRELWRTKSTTVALATR